MRRLLRGKTASRLGYENHELIAGAMRGFACRQPDTPGRCTRMQSARPAGCWVPRAISQRR